MWKEKDLKEGRFKKWVHRFRYRIKNPKLKTPENGFIPPVFITLWAQVCSIILSTYDNNFPLESSQRIVKNGPSYDFLSTCVHFCLCLHVIHTNTSLKVHLVTNSSKCGCRKPLTGFLLLKSHSILLNIYF